MTDILEAARALAKALSPLDSAALGAVLHPDVRVEGVDSNGSEDFKGADAVVEAYVPWYGWYDSQEVLGSETSLVAGLPWVVVRCRLRKGDESWVMETHHCIYQQDDGRITWLGLLCTGPQPEH